MCTGELDSPLKPNMHARKVLPLSLLYTAGGKIKGRTRFQKLVFLADQRLEDEDIDAYDFIPYNYGPFDKDLYSVLNFLESRGLIGSTKTPTYGGDERYDYWLTEKGRESYQENLPGDPDSTAEEKFITIHNTAESVTEEYGDLPISNLIQQVYDDHPEYAENSILKE